MSETLSQDPDGLGVAYTTLAPSYPPTPATPSSTVQDIPSGANLPPFSTFAAEMDATGTFSSVSDRLFSDTRLLDISNWDYYTEARLIERGENGLSVIASQPQYRPWESKPVDSTGAFAGTTQVNTFSDAFANQNGASKLPSFQSQFQAFNESVSTTEPTTLTTLTNLTPVSPNSSSSPQSQSLTTLNSSFHTLSAVNPRSYPLVPAPIQAREIPSIQQQFLDERHIQLYSHPTANLTLNNTIHSASIFPAQNGAIIQNSQIISSPTVVTVLKSEPDLKLTTLHQADPTLKLQNVALHPTQFQNPMPALNSDAGLYNGIDKKINGTTNIMTSPTRNDFRKKERRKMRASSLESSAESDGASSNMDLGAENSGQVAAVSSTDGFKNQHGMPMGMEHDITGGHMDKQVKKKRKRCGECIGCQRKDNCGDCAPCRNDKSHQICKQRRCEKLTEKKSYRGRKPNGPITPLGVTGGIPVPPETNGGVAPPQPPPSRPSPQPTAAVAQPMPVQQQPMTPMPFYADPNRFPTPVWQADPSQVSGWQGQFIQQIPQAGQPIDTYQQYPNGIYQATYQQPAFEANTFYAGAVQVLTPANARPPSVPSQQAQMVPPRPNSNYAHTPSPSPAAQQNQQQSQQQAQQQQNTNRQYQEYNQFGSNASGNDGSQSRPSSVNSVVNQNPPTPNQNFNQGQQQNQQQQAQQQQTVYATVSAANFSPSSNQQQTQFVNANSGNGQPGYPQVNASSPQVVSHNSSGYPGNEQFGGQHNQQQWQTQEHQQMMWEHQQQQQQSQDNKMEQQNYQQQENQQANNQEQYMSQQNTSPTKMQTDGTQKIFSQADKVNLNSRIKTMILNKQQQNEGKAESDMKSVEQNNSTGHFLWYSHHHHLDPLSVDGGPPKLKSPNCDKNILSENTHKFAQSNFNHLSNTTKVKSNKYKSNQLKEQRPFESDNQTRHENDNRKFIKEQNFRVNTSYFNNTTIPDSKNVATSESASIIQRPSIIQSTGISSNYLAQKQDISTKNNPFYLNAVKDEPKDFSYPTYTELYPKNQNIPSCRTTMNFQNSKSPELSNSVHQVNVYSPENTESPKFVSCSSQSVTKGLDSYTHGIPEIKNESQTTSSNTHKQVISEYNKLGTNSSQIYNFPCKIEKNLEKELNQTSGNHQHLTNPESSEHLKISKLEPPSSVYSSFTEPVNYSTSSSVIKSENCTNETIHSGCKAKNFTVQKPEEITKQSTSNVNHINLNPQTNILQNQQNYSTDNSQNKSSLHLQISRKELQPNSPKYQNMSSPVQSSFIQQNDKTNQGYSSVSPKNTTSWAKEASNNVPPTGCRTPIEQKYSPNPSNQNSSGFSPIFASPEKTKTWLYEKKKELHHSLLKSPKDKLLSPDSTVNVNQSKPRNLEKSNSSHFKNAEEIPQCHCFPPDQATQEPGNYYTHLGCADSLRTLRHNLECQTGVSGAAIRIEKVKYTGKEGKTAQGCPIVKWVHRRISLEEKYLVIVKHRTGHFCQSAFIVVCLVVWEGVSKSNADDLYSLLTDKLNKFGLPTKRRCATNDPRTCACQGIDEDKCGASFSFGCSWSMYYNGCKFTRSKEVRKFRLSVKEEENLLEEKLQNLADHVSPIYKILAPQSFKNQTHFEHVASECRLGTIPGRPFSGVTACMDFCAHSHKDIHNMNDGCTVVVTLSKNRNLGKPEDDEQLHVLPLYVPDDTDEFGSKESQEMKVAKGEMEILKKFECEVRTFSEPAEKCRNRKGKREKEREENQKRKKSATPQPSSPSISSTTYHHPQKDNPVPYVNSEIQNGQVSSTVLESPNSRTNSPSWRYDNSFSSSGSHIPNHNLPQFSVFKTSYAYNYNGFSNHYSQDGYLNSYNPYSMYNSFANHPTPNLFSHFYPSQPPSPQYRVTNPFDDLYTTNNTLPVPPPVSGGCKTSNDGKIKSVDISYTDNSDCFKDPDIGGVAIALSHGSILFECAKHEVHATTALKKPDRTNPTRISLVFYQHRNMNKSQHGLDDYNLKQKSKLDISQSDPVDLDSSFDSSSVNSSFEDLDKCSSVEVVPKTVTLPTFSLTTIFPMYPCIVTGPYQEHLAGPQTSQMMPKQ